jgi:hypothetical protein
MTWDTHMDCVLVKWAQIKTHKFKTVMLAAGANRFGCNLNALACAFASGCFSNHIFDPDDLNLLYRSLGALKAGGAVSNTISRWLQAMAEGSTNQTYAGYRQVTSL